MTRTSTLWQTGRYRSNLIQKRPLVWVAFCLNSIWVDAWSGGGYSFLRERCLDFCFFSPPCVSSGLAFHFTIEHILCQHGRTLSLSYCCTAFSSLLVKSCSKRKVGGFHLKIVLYNTWLCFHNHLHGSLSTLAIEEFLNSSWKNWSLECIFPWWMCD